MISNFGRKLGQGLGEKARQTSLLSVYEQHRPSIKTGDVLAFSGNAGFSKFIRWSTGSIYSHVGIVLNTNLGGGFGDSVLVIESRTETIGTDAAGVKLLKGVQLQWLSKRILMYDGAVWLLPLKKPLPEEGKHKMQAWLRETNNKITPYDSVQLMGAGLDLFDRMKLSYSSEDLSTLFCSELVTKALQIAGVVDASLSPSEQTPRDVVNFPIYNAPILFKSDSDPVG